MKEDRRKYGIWSTISKKFVFGIAENTRAMAFAKLKHKIGDDSYKSRFVCRRIDNEDEL